MMPTSMLGLLVPLATTDAKPASGKYTLSIGLLRFSNCLRTGRSTASRWGSSKRKSARDRRDRRRFDAIGVCLGAAKREVPEADGLFDVDRDDPSRRSNPK